ncbi:MAG TPA: hypothetical protein VFQ35_02710 [Polyangiaceae bacterium]|nr:hypothetical protein [Polyangiaceae bacterium]
MPNRQLSTPPWLFLERQPELQAAAFLELRELEQADGRHSEHAAGA